MITILTIAAVATLLILFVSASSQAYMDKLVYTEKLKNLDEEYKAMNLFRKELHIAKETVETTKRHLQVEREHLQKVIQEFSNKKTAKARKNKK